MYDVSAAMTDEGAEWQFGHETRYCYRSGLPPVMPSSIGAMTRNQYFPGRVSEKKNTIKVKKSDKSGPIMIIPMVRVRPWRSKN